MSEAKPCQMGAPSESAPIDGGPAPAPDPQTSSTAAANSNCSERIGLALSGGGFRATLFHLGVIAYLRYSGQLKNVKHICSVSGGSILAAHMALNWSKYNGTDLEFNEVTKELIQFIRSDVRGRIMRTLLLRLTIVVGLIFIGLLYVFLNIGWFTYNLVSTRGIAIAIVSLIVVAVVCIFLVVGVSMLVAFVFAFLQRKGWMPFSVTNEIERRYQELFPARKLVGALGVAEKVPKVELLCTSMTTGDLCWFDSTGFTIALAGEAPTTYAIRGHTIARAVTASSAFTVWVPPVPLLETFHHVEAEELPAELYLTDGGAYDNLGLRRLREVHKGKNPFCRLVVSDAQAGFEWQLDQRFISIFSRGMRASDLLMKRITEFEKKEFRTDVENETLLLIELDSEVGNGPVAPEQQRGLRRIRTDLDEFSVEEISLLIMHGFYVASHVDAKVKNGVPGVENSCESVKRMLAHAFAS